LGADDDDDCALRMLSQLWGLRMRIMRVSAARGRLKGKKEEEPQP
jgi:hypothetical protein